MKKLALSLVVSLSPIPALAVDCQFIPLAVKAGAFNSKENNLLVCSDASANQCYNLGLATDDQAKNRYSAALSALVSGKSVRLRFPSQTTCENAIANFPVPNETILFAQ